MEKQDKKAYACYIADQLMQAAHPAAVVLFGSNARGDAREDSDIDLLVVWDENADLPHAKRRMLLRKMLGMTEVPVDIITCSTAELARAMQDSQSFTAQIIREGELLYGRL